MTNMTFRSQKIALWSGAFFFLLAFSGTPTVYSQGLKGLKIGVVHLNQALNASKAGKRSKSILEASTKQKQNELKAQEQKLLELREQLKNGMMLKPSVRAEKERVFREQEKELRRDVLMAQREYRAKERKITQSIFLELKTVIDEIARKEKFDLVLEKNASEVILFSTKKFIDITDKVIARYDRFQSGK